MTWYETVAEMQKDLDAYREIYSRQQPHRGRGMKGRAPYDVFKAGIPKKSLYTRLGRPCLLGN